MMTNDYVDRFMRESVADPVAMARNLGFHLTPQQSLTINQMARATGRMDFARDANDEVVRSVLLTSFWRTLRNPQSLTLLLADNVSERKRAMRFLTSMAAQDHAMASVVSFPRWYRMLIAKDQHWKIVAPVCTRPENIAGLHEDNITIVALSDGQSSTSFKEVLEVARPICSGPNDLFVQLWDCVEPQ